MTSPTPQPPPPTGAPVAGPLTTPNSPQPPGDAKARHAADPSVGQLVNDVTTHLSTIVHSEIELAKLEVKASVKNAGTGVVFFLAAAVLLVFSLTFGFIALAEGLVAAGIWRWAAFLIVFGLFVLVAAVLVFLGIKKVKRIKGAPQTIATGKATVEYLKTHTGRD